MKHEQLGGLSSHEVAARRRRDGFNELPDREKRNIFTMIISVLSEPMIFLLVAVVVVYFLLGDHSEAMVLMVSVLVVISIEVYQDGKTEKALDALRSLASPNCEVIREGRHQTIPSREVVVGDLIVVSEGGRVPADARLVTASNLMSDESILTGESVPVEKSIGAHEDERLGRIFSGTMIVKGHATAEVTAIGAKTEMGEIGTSLKSIMPEKTLLQKEIARVVKIIAIIAVSTSVLLTLLFWILRGDLLQGFLAGLTLSIAILPEEFPVVLTVFMALGAWRLAKGRVLSRRNQTIETLGSATVLCTDKTGTLTENRMSVARVTDASGVEISSGKHYVRVLSASVLASQKNPFDPMEEAFIEAVDDPSKIYGNLSIVKEYPLEESSMSVAHIWAKPDGTLVHLAIKGAPEAVFALCDLTKAKHEALKKEVQAYAREGLRVLAVAEGRLTRSSDIARSRDAYNYDFLGLVALADPIRKEAARAVEVAHEAGIRVVMITGDYAETARRIGKEIGLRAERVVTGEEFAAASASEQRAIVAETEIFSRVAPRVKLDIVNALKAEGEVVAMTGDGVNDGPALKTAHIGISMGQRGTDVAREASSLVLLDDNFASIVRGVRIGRRIFANLQKAAIYILTVHIPIAVLSLVPVLFGWPMILMPIHIVFLEFIIDPSCTLVFEAEKESPNTMKRAPRRLGSPLFSKSVVWQSLIEGMVLVAIMVLAHWYMLENGWGEDHARAITFLLVTLTNVMLILAISGKRAVADAFARGVTPLTVVVTVVSLVLVLVYTIEPVRTLFKFSAISIEEALAAFGVARVAVSLLFPLRKLLGMRATKV